jgi:hypothetical protein
MTLTQAENDSRTAHFGENEFCGDDVKENNPPMNGRAIFRGSGATAKTASGTGALPIPKS